MPDSIGRAYSTASAAYQLAWNIASDRFYIRSTDGWFIPYTFNAGTMTAARLQPSATGYGGLVITSQVEPQFSFLSAPILLFTSNWEKTLGPAAFSSEPEGTFRMDVFLLSLVRRVGLLPFTDDPLIVGATAIRALHITELRQRIDALRARFGLASFAWTDPTLGAGVTARAVHLTDLANGDPAGLLRRGTPGSGLDRSSHRRRRLPHQGGAHPGTAT